MVRFESSRKASAMRQIRGRKMAEVFVEPPIGGWNTRDAVDNVPPQDALVLDNWIPDIGTVRARRGFTEHADISSIESGSNLVLNPGFETAGGGDPDFWANWTEVAGDGVLANETTVVKSGSDAAKVQVGTSKDTYIHQSMAVTAAKSYKLAFWYANGGRKTFTGSYAVYDVTNAAYIISKTNTGAVSALDTYYEKIAKFVTPAGCVSVRIELWCHTQYGSHAFIYYDDVSLYETYAQDHTESLMVYKSGTVEKMLAACADNIFDVSTVGSPVQKAGPFTSDRWQYINMDGKMGMVNGSDTPQQYDGAAVSTLTISGADLTTADGSDLIGCNVFKSRSYFWEVGSQDVFYSAVDALGGALTKLPLSRLGRFGGYLVSMVTWTRDGGAGPDDHAVFIMSSGEVLVYAGISPAATADWSLVGIYNIGTPLEIRATAKFGGDILIMTTLDFGLLSEIIGGEESYIAKHKAIGAVKDATGSYSSNWGWECIPYFKDKLMIFNIPISVNSEYHQYVMNMATTSWCRIKGFNANTFAIYNDDLYFGTANSIVNKAFVSGSDNGTEIDLEIQTAWLDLGSKAHKSFVGVEFNYKTAGVLAENADFAVDYKEFDNVDDPTATAVEGTPWGSPWGSPWSTPAIAVRTRKLISGYGRVISMYQKAAVKATTEWFASHWWFRQSRGI